MALIISSALEIEVPENQSNQVIYVAVASDADNPSGQIVYSLAPGAHPNLSIDATTGEVTYQGALDFEAQSSLSFKVVATDENSNSVSQEVTLLVTNLDEAAPVLVSNLDATVDEGIGAGQVVYRAEAQDNADVSGGVAFTLSEDSDAALSINASTGEVTLANDPDFAAQSSYQFTVIATDLAGNVDQRAVSLAVNQVLEGAASDDVFQDASNRQVFVGLEGADRVEYIGASADYQLEVLESGDILVTERATGIADRHSSIETIEFSDKSFLVETVYSGGSEFQVNTYTSDNQQEPSVTGLADGGFVVTWMSANQDGSSWGVYGQRYAADGAASGDEFLINTVTNDEQSYPSVTGLADGGFVVTWMSHNQDGDSWGVYGQRYAADGAASGDEFLINTYTSNQQQEPSVTALNDGGFVVTWMSNGNDGSGWGVYGQRYAADGAASGTEFLINSYTSNNQYDPSVTALADGGFVVTWRGSDQDGSGYGVFGQRYAADGTATGTEFQVNTYTSDSQQEPSVTGLADGGFVVTWMSHNQDGSLGCIRPALCG